MAPDLNSNGLGKSAAVGGCELPSDDDFQCPPSSRDRKVKQKRKRTSMRDLVALPKNTRSRSSQTTPM